MSEYIDANAAAKFKGVSERHIRRLCREGRLAGAVNRNGQWSIPAAADAKFSGVKMPEDLLSIEGLHDIPVKKRDEALKRLGFIQEFEKFSAKFVRADGNRTDACRIFAKQNNIAFSSFKRWQLRYKCQGLFGLVDTRGGAKLISDMISPEAFEYFKSMFLTEQRLSVRLCLGNINYINKTEDRGWKVPSSYAMYRYVKDHIPLAVQVLHREGQAAYEAKCAPYVQRDPESVRPGQVWVGDHHQCNCWIRHRNKWVRPWITAWNDMASRAVVGVDVNAAPNQTTIMLAMKRGIEAYGPPDMVKIDNGKDYDSEMFTGTTKVKRREYRKALKTGYIDEPTVAGIYAMMDVGVSFSIPYHPQSKPIERWFDTLDRQLCKTMDTYCGKDSKRKPEKLNDLLARQSTIDNAMNLDDFTELVKEYITKVYNHTAHRGAGMDGRSPAEVMAARPSKRVLAAGVIDMLMRVWSGELKVGKNGVNFKKLYYGQFNMDLMNYQGKKVRVAYDPDDLRMIYVYEANTLKLITMADQNELMYYADPVSEEALREAMKQKGSIAKQLKAHRNIQLTANMDLPSLTIKAMAAATRPAPDTSKVRQALRPVSTAFDNQVAEHNRRLRQKIIKKAVGAENDNIIDIDLSILSGQDKKPNISLFDK
ncbi:MAG: DDE-type integrase/transposase/recombinase [Planctomycetes bacterium]|nr:DDE-type integrase/transposase/recombinase [Planctomycetota bacterium]